MPSRPGPSAPVAGKSRIPLSAAPGLGVLLLGTFTAITTELLPVGLLPQMSRELRVDEATAGLLVSAYAVVVGMLAVPVTVMTARWSRKRLLLLALVGYAAGNLVIALGPTFAIVCLGRGLGGIAHAVFFSVVSVYASRLVPAALEGRAIALVFSGTSLGFVLGVPLATSLGDAVGWRIAFASIGVMTAVLALLTAMFLPPMENHHSRRRGHGGLRSSGIIAVAAATAIGFLGHYTLYTYISALLLGTGLPESAIGPVLLLLGAAGILGLWAAGATIDRIPRLAFLVTLMVATLGVALLLPATGSPVAVVTAAALWSVAFGAMPTFLTAAAIRTRAAAPEISAAVNNSMSNVGIAVGAGLGAAVYARFDIQSVIVVSAVLFALALGTVWLARRGFPAAVDLG